ncbi:hypothetical protein [Paenibacillus sp. KS-LC4]|uniref:hypothetical protein n=1 Tax=Paenibacillus sp. KS-LC4 TaxID=2979727 RepID=UPI0030CF6D2D
MEFDFFLRVMQDRFNMDGDYHSLEFMFSDTRFNMKKMSDSHILVETDAIKLTIESAHSKIDGNDEDFASMINFTRLSRVVIIEVINVKKDSNDLAKAVELILSYFHILLFEDSKNLDTGHIEIHAIKLGKATVNNQGFQVFSDPSTL